MDRVLQSFYETNNGQTVDWSEDGPIGTPRPAEGFLYDDALKFTSALTDFTGHFGKVFSGAENCADLNNRCKNVRLSAQRWYANGGKYPFTIKGGCTGITIEGILEGHGSECDVDAGNWSDQDHDYVNDWELALIPADNKPIIVRCLAAEKPRLRAGTGPYYFIFPDPAAWYHSLVVSGFNQLHRCGFFA